MRRRGTGCYYLLLSGFEPLLGSAADIARWEAQLEAALRLHSAQVHAYCWTAEQAHLAIELSGDPLTHFGRTLCGAWAGRKYPSGMTASHWIYSHMRVDRIGRTRDLLHAARQIHRVPLLRGYPRPLSEYTWSSHRCYLGTDRQSWLTKRVLWSLLADHAIDYVRWIEAESPAASDAARLSPEPRTTALNHIVQAVAECLGLPAIEIVSARHTRRSVMARNLVAWIATLRHVADQQAVSEYFGLYATSLSHTMRRCNSLDLEQLTRDCMPDNVSWISASGHPMQPSDGTPTSTDH